MAKFIGYGGKNLETGIITTLEVVEGYYLKFEDNTGHDIVFVPEILVSNRKFIEIAGDNSGILFEMITSNGRIGLFRSKKGEIDLKYSINIGAADIDSGITAETNSNLILQPDGIGGVDWNPIPVPTGTEQDDSFLALAGQLEYTLTQSPLKVNRVSMSGLEIFDPDDYSITGNTLTLTAGWSIISFETPININYVF